MKANLAVAFAIPVVAVVVFTVAKAGPPESLRVIATGIRGLTR